MRTHVLVDQLASFNWTWPRLIVDGRVWQVPLLNEQKTPDVLEVQEVDGQAAIALATAALASRRHRDAPAGLLPPAGERAAAGVGH